MISVEEALQLVHRAATELPSSSVPLTESLGQVLAADITSDVDSPPHDKALMDGYALRIADVTAPKTRLRVLEEIVAGRMPTRPLERGTASRIMTGAPIPDGADAVVMFERTTDVDGGQVEINDSQLVSRQNILQRASVMSAGETVLRRNRTIGPTDIGLLAEVGVVDVPVVRRPKVAILATGDELVPHQQTPGPGQIRNSNAPMLAAMVQRSGGAPIALDIGSDDRAQLSALVRHGLAVGDMLLLSGGVSAGVKDYVPSVLAAAGVEKIFHKVNLKPGKPLWFGLRAAEARERALVFGLPGNPVSALVCSWLFVAPALERLAGRPPRAASPTLLPLAIDFSQGGDRPTYYPASATDGQLTPLPWKGSADLRTLSAANGFLFLPPGEHRLLAGESVQFYAFS